MMSLSRNTLPMTALAVALLGLLAGCQRQAPSDAAALPPSASTAPAIQPAPAAAAYQPPTAEQLYALVSPIALFPDKLVALTLAASTHPDDVHAARGFLEDRRNLSGAALLDAADGEPWDPSVKALVAFPAVVDQLDGHDDWTAALGAAYAAEPSDVLNAIQVMRQRARAHGSLSDTAQQTIRVVDTPVPATVVERRVVEAPAQTIEIEPTQPDVVYVPSYDPDVVYGEPVYSRVYTTERWYRPGPDRGDLVATGLLSFGAGVLVGELFAHEHHADRPWGWNAWRTSWGGSRGGGYGAPAVVYDNHPYVVNRTTVINRYTHIDRSVHIDNRHDFDNVSVHNRVDRGAPATAPAQVPVPPRAVDFAHVQRPNFSPAMMHATAANGRPALPPPAATRTPDAPRPATEPARPPTGHAMAEHQPPHRDATPAGEPHRDAVARAAQPPRDMPPAHQAQPEHERHAPAPAPIAARAQPHDEARMPSHDDLRDAPRLAQHTQQARAPEMPRHIESHPEPRAQPHVEARPEQHPRAAPPPHRDGRHESGHKDDRGH